MMAEGNPLDDPFGKPHNDEPVLGITIPFSGPAICGGRNPHDPCWCWRMAILRSLGSRKTEF